MGTKEDIIDFFNFMAKASELKIGEVDEDWIGDDEDYVQYFTEVTIDELNELIDSFIKGREK